MLTIVIPTFERPGYLRRTLRWLASQDCEFTIHVLDSSHQPVEEDLSARHGLSVTVTKFDSSIGVAAKLARGLASVETPLVQILADDDLLFLDAVREAAEVLTSHPDYAAATGDIVSFKSGAASGLESLRRIHQRGIPPSGTGAQRLRALFADYCTYAYALQRTPSLRAIFEDLGRVPFGGDSRSAELYWYAIVAMSGGVRHSPRLYCLRERGNERFRTLDTNSDWLRANLGNLAELKETLSARLRGADDLEGEN